MCIMMMVILDSKLAIRICILQFPGRRRELNVFVFEFVHVLTICDVVRVRLHHQGLRRNRRRRRRRRLRPLASWRSLAQARALASLAKPIVDDVKVPVEEVLVPVAILARVRATLHQRGAVAILHPHRGVHHAGVEASADLGGASAKLGGRALDLVARFVARLDAALAPLVGGAGCDVLIALAPLLVLLESLKVLLRLRELVLQVRVLLEDLCHQWPCCDLVTSGQCRRGRQPCERICQLCGHRLDCLAIGAATSGRCLLAAGLPAAGLLAAGLLDPHQLAPRLLGLRAAQLPADHGIQRQGRCLHCWLCKTVLAHRIALGRWRAMCRKGNCRSALADSFANAPREAGARGRRGGQSDSAALWRLTQRGRLSRCRGPVSRNTSAATSAADGAVHRGARRGHGLARGSEAQRRGQPQTCTVVLLA
mmetsp:Transcript_34262/g.87169  ORF Transcript_34262/g.87169 Transcript_34262/m.87169 type:complete len:424 (-) Transcript_34262:457-1728(-)